MSLYLSPLLFAGEARMLYSRNVSANERLYLASEKGFGQLILQLIVEGCGRIDPEALQSAIEKAAVTHPGCRVRRQGSHWTADGPLPHLRVTAGCPDFYKDLNRSARLHGVLHDEQVAEIELFADGDRCILAFRCLHAVADAQGLLLWARAVFSFLRGETPPSALSPLSDRALVAKLGVKARSEAPLSPSSIGFQGKADGQHRYSLSGVTIAGVHVGISARIAVMMRDYFEDPDATFMVPVDL